MSDCTRTHMHLSRVLLIAELLCPLRRGATVGDLLHDVSEIMGTPCCERTIYRDLAFLESLGIAEKISERDHTPRWRWVDRSIRAAVCERMAAICGEHREQCAA